MPDYPKSRKPTNKQKKNQDPDLHCLDDLLGKEIADLHAGEILLSSHYNGLMKAAFCEDLQDHFFNCVQANKARKGRLEQIHTRFNFPDNAEVFSPAIEQMVKGTEMICKSGHESDLRDIRLIHSALQAESILVSSYLVLTEFCETLGHYKMGEILDTSLADLQNSMAELSELLKASMDRVLEAEEYGKVSTSLLSLG